MIKKISKEEILNSLYITFFILIMFSGATFLSNYVMQFVVVLIFILFCCSKIKGFSKIAYKSKGSKLLKFNFLLIIVFLVSQLSYSFVPSITMVFIERFIAFFFLLHYVPKPKLIYKTIKAIRFVAFPVAISIIGMTLISGTKSGGLVGTYQYSGMLMSICFGVLLIDYFFEKNNFNLVGLILILLALLTSGKRTFTLLACLAFFIIYMMTNDKEKRKKFLKLSLILGVGFIIAYSTIPAVRLVFERFSSYSNDTTYNGRSFYWNAAFQIYNNNKIHGIGMGCFSSYFDIYFHRFGNVEAYDAHNIYIQMISEIGIVGTGLFILSFIIALLKTLKLLRSKEIKNNKENMYILCYTIYLQLWFIIYGFTGNPLYGASQAFFYYSAVSMVLSLNTWKKKVGE